MANIGRIIAGIGTLGASELVAKPLSDAADASETALANIKGRKVADLNLGEGVGTSRIAAAGEKIAGTPQAKVTDAGGFTSSGDAAGYIKGLQSSLGLKGPKSAIDATRDAATRKLDEQTYQQSLQDAQQLASQGQSTGARSQALGVLRGQALAGNKANLEADLQQNEAATMNDYEKMLLNMAQSQGGAMSTQALNRSQQLNQANQFNTAQQAQREMAQANLEQDVGSALNANEYQRAMASYQNKLDQLQQQNSADVMALQQASDKTANITGIIGSAIGAGSRIASAGIA